MKNLFQSTHPHGVRPRKAACKCTETLGFNPRTHMGCDMQVLLCLVVVLCFNPRTHMGCDILLMLIKPMQMVFQSTHPHGVRQFLDDLLNCWYVVSIHAPTWGATEWNKIVLNIFTFQSTHPHGVRLWFNTKMSQNLCFNPRTHMGCDWIHFGDTRSRNCFNPRTHMGCD